MFYDPFSTKTNRDFWTLDGFTALFQICRQKPCRVYTYSNATSVRAALLTTGFHVAEGVGFGPKDRTTVTVTAAAVVGADADGLDWLGRRWRGRFERSAKPYPDGSDADARARIDTAVNSHSQFEYGDFQGRSGIENGDN